MYLFIMGKDWSGFFFLHNKLEPTDIASHINCLSSLICSQICYQENRNRNIDFSWSYMRVEEKYLKTFQILWHENSDYETQITQNRINLKTVTSRYIIKKNENWTNVENVLRKQGITYKGTEIIR
jgi:hypothetical protein